MNHMNRGMLRLTQNLFRTLHFHQECWKLPKYWKPSFTKKWIGSRMAPVELDVDQLINKHNVMVFSRSDCPFCAKVKALFSELGVEYFALELDHASNGQQIKEALIKKTNQKTVPNVFIRGRHVGGCDDCVNAHEKGTLLLFIRGEAMPEPKYLYDLIVIGGGSGGIAAAKESVNKRFKKVALCDFVKPSPCGTSWGLGGTCVNVGCIPKKLLHKAALLGQDLQDASHYGWQMPDKVPHDWGRVVEKIQEYIKSLNWGYRSILREKGIVYHNSFVEFVDNHTVKLTDKKGKIEHITADKFIIAVGGRPRYLPIPGIEHCISSDDLFSLPYSPQKTLLIGASYIALECAGFLHGLGFDCTVMVRSILLRGFDQEMANKIGKNMEDNGVKFIREHVPVRIDKIVDGKPGLLRVTGKARNGDEKVVGDYNTVIFAVGRTPCTTEMGLKNIGMTLNPNNMKIVCDEKDQTSVNNIFALGDVSDGKPELTPSAIQAGKLLARRLYGNSELLMDYENVPTTIFTPLEYGCVGLSEDTAIERYGEDNVEVYHKYFMPLEFELPAREKNKCFAKLVCLKSQNEKVVGFHVLGPNAGEITQGFALGVKLGATKADFDNTVGIHPTCAEAFTIMDVTKSSGASAALESC